MEELGIAALVAWEPEDEGSARSHLLRGNNSEPQWKGSHEEKGNAKNQKARCFDASQTSVSEELTVYRSDLSAGGFLFSF